MSLSDEIKAAIGGDGRSRHQTRCLYEQWAARVGELEVEQDELKAVVIAFQLIDKERKQTFNEYVKRMHRAEDEVIRLRETLQEILDEHDSWFIHEAARKALEES